MLLTAAHAVDTRMVLAQDAAVTAIGEGVRPGAAGAQQHGQALARIGEPGYQRVES
jgi:hypothetical protein